MLAYTLYSAVKKKDKLNFALLQSILVRFSKSRTVTSYASIASLLSGLSNKLSFIFMSGHYWSAEEKSELLESCTFRYEDKITRQ